MKRKTKRYMNAAPMAPRPSIMPSAADAGKPDSLSGLRLATSEDLMAGGPHGTLEESLYGAAGGPLLSDAAGDLAGALSLILGGRGGHIDYLVDLLIEFIKFQRTVIER